MTIGARVLKTGMAVALAIYLSSLFGFASPLITAVAAIFTIQPSIYRSWQNVADQVQTNLLGAVIALAAVRLFGHTPIAAGLVCILVIMISIRLKMESTISLTLVTVVAIMEANGQGWDMAIERFLMVLTGIGSSFLVNVLVFPPRPRRQFTEQVHQAYTQLSLLLRTAVSNEMKEQVFRQEKDKLHGTLRKLEERHTVFEEERKVLARAKTSHARQLLVSKQMIKALQKGADLLDVVEEHYFASPSAGEWALRFDRQIEDLSKYHEHILLKAEDKMKPNALIEPEEEREARFVKELTAYVMEDPDEHKRLIFVASGLFEYAYHLRRLEKLLDQVQQREESAKRGDDEPEED
ncbi:aromatic acid exporter family protein [Paenibacillus sp. LHD-38]|uniref:FUSC family protein n=1 Tax=Paenibacillus sp. LHD-38 TaxID=3072143 RepID=UPI00280DD27E|nr:aromatic acid exporter family protein [Paenibacillus sp. LHD-38]MDQ8736147.1 aromatic acid exporter family protein [Paenibacillus sp. LHD-38]